MANEKRLIDANEAYEAVIDLSGQADTKSAYAAFWKAGKEIQELSTVYAVEVVHGRWERFETIIGNIGVLCSICGWKDYHHGRFKRNLFPYCPNCGAKMDGVTDG